MTGILLLVSAMLVSCGAIVGASTLSRLQTVDDISPDHIMSCGSILCIQESDPDADMSLFAAAVVLSISFVLSALTWIIRWAMTFHFTGSFKVVF